jgi:hypothetical protein
MISMVDKILKKTWQKKKNTNDKQRVFVCVCVCMSKFIIEGPHHGHKFNTNLLAS